MRRRSYCANSTWIPRRIVLTLPNRPRQAIKATTTDHVIGRNDSRFTGQAARHSSEEKREIRTTSRIPVMHQLKSRPEHALRGESIQNNCPLQECLSKYQ